MKKLVFMSLAAVVATLALAVPASASPKQAVGGEFTVVSLMPTGIRAAGPNCFIDADVTFSLTGDVTGVFTSLPLRIVHHGPCDPLGPAAETFQGQGSLAGTVGTAAGTFDFNFRGTADAAGNAEAKLTIQNASGGLAGLRGSITLTGITGVGGTYEGRLHFD